MSTTVKILLVALIILAIWFGVYFYNKKKTTANAPAAPPDKKPEYSMLDFVYF